MPLIHRIKHGEKAQSRVIELVFLDYVVATNSEDLKIAAQQQVEKRHQEL